MDHISGGATPSDRQLEILDGVDLESKHSAEERVRKFMHDDSRKGEQRDEKPWNHFVLPPCSSKLLDSLSFFAASLSWFTS